MFAPPSLQRDYVLCSQYDKALALPVVPDLPLEAAEDEVKRVREIQTDRDLKLKNARERGDWAPLIKPGDSPTRFTFHQVPRRSVNWWLGEIERRRLSHDEGLELVFRLALESVDNLGAYKAEHEEIDGHRILKTGSLDKLYELVGASPVFELASVVLMRMRGASPLS